MNKETDVERFVREWEQLPEIQCNHCLVVFKGGHDCDYEKLKQDNKRFREALSNIKDEEEQHLEGYESVVYKIARQALEVERCD